MTGDVLRWGCYTRVDKYRSTIEAAHSAPYEVTERRGNLLMYYGASLLWQWAIGNGTATAGDDLTYLSETNAFIGVGNDTTASAETQTDLQASTSKLRRGMNSGFPSHSDGGSSSNASIEFQATFGSNDANFAWEEWGIFNASFGGRMLNRKVDSLGTKSVSNVWVITVTLTIA